MKLTRSTTLMLTTQSSWTTKRRPSTTTAATRTTSHNTEWKTTWQICTTAGLSTHLWCLANRENATTTATATTIASKRNAMTTATATATISAPKKRQRPQSLTSRLVFAAWNLRDLLTTTESTASRNKPSLLSMIKSASASTALSYAVSSKPTSIRILSSTSKSPPLVPPSTEHVTACQVMSLSATTYVKRSKTMLTIDVHN